jgi:hypothetical protein
VISALRQDPGHLPVAAAAGPHGDAVTDEDLQLTLWVCYELHYRGFEGTDERWEWDPGLLGLRSGLEKRFEDTLRAAVTVPPASPNGVPRALAALTAADDGPPLSAFLARKATVDQFAEFVAHRSVYHLKEADPHSFGIPRLAGPAKAALVEIQSDEYGGGRPDRMHQTMFAATMRSLGLDDGYGGYVDAVPAVTLATSNAISLFGLHRRLRGALAGHLAAFEMTSSEPNRRYGNGLRRLGGDAQATAFYDEHVVADAVHEQIAAHDLCGSLAASEPGLVPDILFGAAAALMLDARFAGHLLDRWATGQSSLRIPGALAVARPA